MSSSVPFKEMAVTLIDVISLLMGMMKGYLFNKEVKSVDVAVFCIYPYILSWHMCVSWKQMERAKRKIYHFLSAENKLYFEAYSFILTSSRQMPHHKTWLLYDFTAEK